MQCHNGATNRQVLHRLSWWSGKLLGLPFEILLFVYMGYNIIIDDPFGAVAIVCACRAKCRGSIPAMGQTFVIYIRLFHVWVLKDCMSSLFLIPIVQDFPSLGSE